MSWKYATPSTTTALLERLPNAELLPVIGVAQDCFSWVTLDELIDEVTSRVPAWLPFGSVHADATPADEPPLDGGVVVADVVDAAVVLAEVVDALEDDVDEDDVVLPADGVDDDLLLPQP